MSAPLVTPCPECKGQFDGQMPGHVYGSNWDWVPCQTCSAFPDGVEVGQIVVEMRVRAVTPCPECGDPVDFLTTTGHTTPMAARIDDVAPWTCTGCGCHGVGDDLTECPDCGETVGPLHFCYRCEDCTTRTDDLALVTTPGGDICPVCLAALVAAPS